MLGWLAYATVAVVWGSTYFAIALGLESFTPYGMVAARFTLAGTLAFGLGRLRREPWPGWPDTGHLMVVGALLLGGANALVSWAELHLPSSLAAILAALLPLWLALFSARTEPLGRLGWTGLVAGFLGVAVLVWPSGGGKVHAGALAAMVAAPLLWALGTLYGRRRVKGTGFFTHSAIQMATAAGLGLLLAPLTGGFLRGAPTPRALAAVLYLTLFGSLAAFSAYLYLARTWTPGRMGTYAYLNPLVAVVLGRIGLQEPFGVRGLLGMAIILGAVALVQVRPRPAAGTA